MRLSLERTRFTACSTDKAKVYYETRRTLHPFVEWVQGDLATNSSIIQYVGRIFI
jgi:hypothetical protein